MSDNIYAVWKPPFDETDQQRTQRRLKSHCPEGFDERIQVLKVTPGYCHTLYEGTCDVTVTVQDIERLFCHPKWGGRRSWVSGGRFGIIRHLD